MMFTCTYNTRSESSKSHLPGLIFTSPSVGKLVHICVFIVPHIVKAIVLVVLFVLEAGIFLMVLHFALQRPQEDGGGAS